MLKNLLFLELIVQFLAAPLREKVKVSQFFVYQLQTMNTALNGETKSSLSLLGIGKLINAFVNRSKEELCILVSCITQRKPFLGIQEKLQGSKGLYQH